MHIAQVRLGCLLVDPCPLASAHHPRPLHWYASPFSPESASSLPLLVCILEHFLLNPLFHRIPPLISSSSRVPSMADQVWSSQVPQLHKTLVRIPTKRWDLPRSINIFCHPFYWKDFWLVPLGHIILWRSKRLKAQARKRRGGTNCSAVAARSLL